MKRCTAGHYYDAAQHHRCPLCGVAALRLGGVIVEAKRDAPAVMASTEPMARTTDGNLPPDEHAAEHTVGPTELIGRPERFVQTEEFGPPADDVRPEDDFDTVTRLFVSPPEPPRPQPGPIGPPASPARASGTVAFWQAPGGHAAAAVPLSAPVVGWLVAVEGPCKGQDYRLVSEGNPIGRAAENQVVLADPTVSEREPHAILYFDPASTPARFYLQPGSRHMVYRNADPIFAATLLQPYDTITLGNTQLLFIPLCGDTFRWKAAP